MMNTLTKFQLPTDQVLMLMTNGAATVFGVCRFLKYACSNLIHNVTFKLHRLHFVAETIIQRYSGA